MLFQNIIELISSFTNEFFYVFRMGYNQSKVSVMWLPAQSGKTRKITEQIALFRDLPMCVGDDKWLEKAEKAEQKEEGMEQEDDNFLNIIICSNNKMLVDQTQKRMAADLFSRSLVIHEEEKKGREEIVYQESNDVYAWMSDNDDRTVRDVAYSVTRNKLKMLLCCSHSKRLEKYLNPLIHLLNEDFDNKIFKKKINIWIDEADSSINLWSKYEKILGLPIINKITLVSATFDSVLKKYKEISVIPFEKTYNDKTYYKLQDAEFIICDEKKESAVSYIKHVVKEFDILEDLKPGYCLFAPGDMTIESHNSIKSFFYRNDCAVVVLNGQGKKIYIPDQEPIDLTNELKENSEEIGKVLARKYKELKIDTQFPLVITGQLCLGRGITFQSQDLLFSASIIPYNRNKASLYQCATRIAGNIKDFCKSKHVMYCSTKTKNILLDMENIATNVAKILFEKNETKVDKNLIKTIVKADKINDFEYKVFEEQKEGLAFIKSHLGKSPRKRSDIAPEELLDDDGDNPTVEEIVRRQWGLNKISTYRMVPTNENSWCVYWRPSFFQKD